MIGSGVKAFAIFGPFPPPRHGVSTVNEVIESFAERAGIPVLRFNTAPPSLERSLSIRLHRMRRVAWALVNICDFIRRNRGCAVYLSLSGGLGLIYESVAASLARLGGSPVVMHHHSFRYVDSTYWAMSLLTRAAGHRALHVVLSSEMGAKLKRRYASIQRTMVLSNVWIIEQEATPNSTERKARRVGYLANLSPAKGMLDVLETAKICAEHDLELEFVVAGPFEDESARRLFSDRAAHLKNVLYIGPVYGADKSRFFNSIDVFIFPTRYRNEAEPLVILEALRVSCPVIAFARGCIPSLLLAGAGISVPCDQSFASRAVAELAGWIINPTEFRKRRRAALCRFAQLQSESSGAGATLLRWLSRPEELSVGQPDNLS